MIYYFCPDLNIKSSGIRFLYRHVEILYRHGFDAAILHQGIGFHMPDMPLVPVHYLPAINRFDKEDFVVLPEGFPAVIQGFEGQPARRIAIALNWAYIYKSLGDYFDWRRFQIEQAMVNSPFIGDFVTWAMNLPTHLVVMGINHLLYFNHPPEKTAQESYIRRKGLYMDELRRVLHSRNPAFLEQIAWKAHHDLSEVEYAREIRRSRLFLNLSPAEGLPFSMLEAMRAGALVAGYDGVGGQRELIGKGDKQNRILAGNFDYVTRAQKLEPVLLDIIKGDMSRWEPIIRNSIELSQHYTLEREEESVLAAWQALLSAPPP